MRVNGAAVAPPGNVLDTAVSHAARRLALTIVKPGRGTLQAALASASAGEELVLADGKYTGDDGTNYVLDVHKDIAIRAQNAGLAILSGEDARMVVFIRNGSVVLDGLVLTQGFVSKNFSGDYLSTLPC